MRFILIGVIKLYRLLLSPWVGHSCRFQPTCSVYAMEALRVHGSIRGSWLTIKRLARCGPFVQNVCAYDPVPKGQTQSNSSQE